MTTLDTKAVLQSDRVLRGDDQLTAHLYRSFDAAFGTDAYQQMLEAQDRADQLANEADEQALADAKAEEEFDLWLSDERGESDLIDDLL